MDKAAKGGRFERSVAKQLSLWWTKGQSESVFWRTSGSGARASTRSKTNRRTAFQYGDLCATDPAGQPFIDLITTEIKRGYNRFSIADLLDRSPKAKIQKYEEWFVKIQRDHERAGSFSWLLIVKRDLRETLVFMPKALETELFDAGAIFTQPLLWLAVNSLEGSFNVVGMTFAHFLIGVQPEHVRQLVKEV